MVANHTSSPPIVRAAAPLAQLSPRPPLRRVGVERRALGARERPRTSALAVDCDDHGLHLRRELAVGAAQLDRRRDARRPGAEQARRSGHLDVRVPQLGVVDERGLLRHVVPDVPRQEPETVPEPRVEHLLRVRHVDRLVDVAVRVEVAPPDLDPLLEHAPKLRDAFPGRYSKRAMIASVL